MLCANLTFVCVLGYELVLNKISKNLGINCRMQNSSITTAWLVEARFTTITVVELIVTSASYIRSSPTEIVTDVTPDLMSGPVAESTIMTQDQP